MPVTVLRVHDWKHFRACMDRPGFQGEIKCLSQRFFCLLMRTIELVRPCSTFPERPLPSSSGPAQRGILLHNSDRPYGSCGQTGSSTGRSMEAPHRRRIAMQHYFLQREPCHASHLCNAPESRLVPAQCLPSSPFPPMGLSVRSQSAPVTELPILKPNCGDASSI